MKVEKMISDLANVFFLVFIGGIKFCHFWLWPLRKLVERMTAENIQ